MIRVGNQKGLKDYVNLKRIAESIFLIGFIFAVVFALLFVMLHKVLPLLYVDFDNPLNVADANEVVKIASVLLLVAAVFQISDSIQVIVLGSLRGLQDVKIPTLITFISYWLIGFPVSYFLGKEDAYGSLGIWVGLLIGLTSAAVLLYLRFQYLTRRLINV
jgi:MATE family multidrug resistance protein